MFDSFLLSNSNNFSTEFVKSAVPPPSIYIELNTTKGLLTILQQNSVNSNKTQTIPINIIDDSSHRTQLIFNTTQISTPRAVKFVIAEPNSYVRHIYNVRS